MYTWRESIARYFLSKKETNQKKSPRLIAEAEKRREGKRKVKGAKNLQTIQSYINKQWCSRQTTNRKQLGIWNLDIAFVTNDNYHMNLSSVIIIRTIVPLCNE